MKLWLIIFDISSQVSNGFAIVSAPNPSTAQQTLMSQGSGNQRGYRIIGIQELGPSKFCQVRILTEGISSSGERGLQGPKGDKGDKGNPFTFRDFTREQLESLRGPEGKQGKQGRDGEKGEKGDKGDKGDTGDSFTFEDFTEEQLESLKGPVGPQGPQGEKGDTGEFIVGNGLQINEDTGAIEVVTTNDAEQDNTLPITSAGVHTIVGNIDVLLSLI